MMPSENQRNARRRDALAVEEATPDSLVRQMDAMQGDLAALRCEANEASELAMLGLLSACTAHELRNVLTPALSYAQLARRRPDDAALIEKALDRIVSGLQAAATILGGTLEHAATRAGGGGGGESPGGNETAIDTAARDVVHMLPRHPSQDGINLLIDIEPGLRARIEPVALRQVLLNLLLNAIEAMRSSAASGPPCITLRGRRTSGPCSIVIEVSDNGPGIAPELAERIFEPFVSGSHLAGDRRRCGRAGLGLAICRRLIESAGGTIAYDAKAAAGATFRLALPPAQAALRKAG